MLEKLLNKLKKLLYKPKRSSKGYTAKQVANIAKEEYFWPDHPQLELLIQTALDNPGCIVEADVNEEGLLDIKIFER